MRSMHSVGLEFGARNTKVEQTKSPLMDLTHQWLKEATIVSPVSKYISVQERASRKLGGKAIGGG